MPKKLTLRLTQRTANRFLNLRHEQNLADLLNVQLYHLQLLALRPQYNIFSVPKKNGKKRWIEDPEDRLQLVQDRLAFYLGTVYYLKKTAAAYGFIIGVKRESDPRHIVSNARQHLGRDYLFNADLRDFFHQVKTARLEQLFSTPPFDFNARLVELLVNLCTNQGRLPMGAPTSPVLSNFATIEMDNELLQLAQWADWRYTRYADDLSFSANSDFSEADVQRITSIVEEAGYEFNPDKFKRFGPTDTKVITGVELTPMDVTVPADFLTALRADLDRLQHVMEVAQLMGKHEKWIDRFRQQVAGRVNFVEMVKGKKDPLACEIHDRYDTAIHPSEDFGSQGWRHFGYY